MARIAIMGTGGIGGVVGARLAEAGHDVAFVARGDHLAAIRQNGLKVTSPAGDAHLTGVAAGPDPAEIGPVDLVVHATKMTALAAEPGFVAPLVGPDTAVLTLQNGVDAPAILGEAVGPAHVLGGLIIMSAHIRAPGVVEQVGEFGRIDFGAPDPAAAHLEAPVADWLNVPGLEGRIVPDIRKALWGKFCLLAAGAALMSAGRTNYGPTRDDPEARDLLRDAVAEGAAVAQAEGVDLGGGYVDRIMGIIDDFPSEMTASMRVDLERGKPMELPWFSGAIVRLGRKHGVPTPVHRALGIALRLQEEAAQAAQAGTGAE